MKGFQKLALASAIAALPVSGMAMEPLNDSEMSGVTGQDGINIGLELDQTLDVLIDDTDGLDDPAGDNLASFTQSGGIFIQGQGLSTPANTVVDVNIDAGGDGADAGMLQVKVDIPNDFVLTTGDIYAVDTADQFDGSMGALPTDPIMESTDITFTDGLSLEIHLQNGNNLLELTGDAGAITFGDATDTANNFVFNDSAGAVTGSMVVNELEISGLVLDGTTVNLDDTDGLVIEIGADMTDVAVSMNQLSVDGGTNAIGDVYITGLNMAGNVITVNGK